MPTLTPPALHTCTPILDVLDVRLDDNGRPAALIVTTTCRICAAPMADQEETADG